jgi:hypothetical protein
MFAAAAVIVGYMYFMTSPTKAPDDYMVVSQENGCYSYRFMGTVAETECFPTAYKAAQKLYAMKAYVEYGMNMGLEKDDG